MIVIYMFVFVCFFFFSSTLFSVKYVIIGVVVLAAVVVDVILSSTVVEAFFCFVGVPIFLGLVSLRARTPVEFEYEARSLFRTQPKSFVNI